MRNAVFILLGYLSGSVLYAQIFAKLFGNKNLIEISDDNNPGTVNAFRYGGFKCGILTLVCDLLKGFIPVYLFSSGASQESYFVSLVMVAPVIGHAFPLFNHFQGGKGIAVTFGCLLGLLPVWEPLVTLAAYFILFSIMVKITPNYYRTLATYVCSLISIAFFSGSRAISIGFGLIAIIVLLKLLTSKEEKKQLEVKLLWMH